MTEVSDFDKLTYAGNLENLRDVESDPRYRFVRGDIGDSLAVARGRCQGCDAIVNFAAETHVDRSLAGAGQLHPDRRPRHTGAAGGGPAVRGGAYVQVSTDEVYGSLLEGSSRETDRLSPASPYSASKAGGDMMVHAYSRHLRRAHHHHPRLQQLRPVSVPGEDDAAVHHQRASRTGRSPSTATASTCRDWLYVLDHCSGIDTAMRRGVPGEIYNVGGGNELPNLDVIRRLLAAEQARNRSSRLVQGPSRPRPPLLHRLLEAASAGLEADP